LDKQKSKRKLGREDSVSSKSDRKLTRTESMRKEKDKENEKEASTSEKTLSHERKLSRTESIRHDKDSGASSAASTPEKHSRTKSTDTSDEELSTKDKRKSVDRAELERSNSSRKLKRENTMLLEEELKTLKAGTRKLWLVKE